MTDELTLLEIKAYGETTERLTAQLQRLRDDLNRRGRWSYWKGVFQDPGFPPADVLKYQIAVLTAVQARTNDQRLSLELRYADWCHIFNLAKRDCRAEYPQIAGLGDCYQLTVLWDDNRISAENAQVYAQCVQQLRASLLSIRENVISDRYREIERLEDQLPVSMIGHGQF
ncbi:hypothetical protein [Lactiplantibacillus carotarum]|uniref:hypothetical protein n=1 Tax=Lactiplantibacillus carotarum TaxID=2993456 RepID=UPI00298EF790|nr:hypothetical protein [Lactiplantibacillus carotarum]